MPKAAEMSTKASEPDKVDAYMGKFQHPLAKMRLTMFYNAKDVKSQEKNLRAVITQWLRSLEK